MEEANILEITVGEEKNWGGKNLEILLHITEEASQKIPPNIRLAEDHKLYVVVEGRRPRCYLCNSEAHLKKDCPLAAKQKQQQQQQQKQLPNTPNRKTLLPTPPETLNVSHATE
uniref:CCHC-type domain-containing protein n=1 Tax=Octopus bimaculoides TaxID=37653 RepID=A0A0L8H4C4_OCTBM